MTRKTWITATVFATATAAMLSLTLPATAQDAERGGPRDGARMEQMFERFDLDGDGQITEAEIEGAAAARFAEADTNGDGLLSADEITAAAEARRVARRAARSEAMIERHDANGDGLLSAEEIAEARDGRRLDRMFDAIDADNDGVITQEEVAEMGEMRRGRFGRGHGPRGGFDRF